MDESAPVRVDHGGDIVAGMGGDGNGTKHLTRATYASKLGKDQLGWVMQREAIKDSVSSVRCTSPVILRGGNDVCQVQVLVLEFVHESPSNLGWASG